MAHDNNSKHKLLGKGRLMYKQICDCSINKMISTEISHNPYVLRMKGKVNNKNKIMIITYRFISTAEVTDFCRDVLEL